VSTVRFRFRGVARAPGSSENPRRHALIQVDDRPVFAVI